VAAQSEQQAISGSPSAVGQSRVPETSTSSPLLNCDSPTVTAKLSAVMQETPIALQGSKRQRMPSSGTIADIEQTQDAEADRIASPVVNGSRKKRPSFRRGSPYT
jgi:hypothetical protein